MRNDLRAEQQELQQKVQRQVQRMRRAEKERPTLLRQTLFLGTIGVMFVLPVIAAAYLGLWLDNRASHYEWHWTVCMIVLGIFVGAINVYLFIRERG